MLKFFKFFKRAKESGYDEVVKLISKTPRNARIGIFSHEGADPDSVYSALAFSLAFEQKGFTNVNVFFDASAKELLENASRLTSLQNVCNDKCADIDLAVIVDLNAASRLGEFEKCAMAAKQIIVCDHHENPIIKNNAIISEPQACSTGHVLFKLFKALDVKITGEIASLLYISIMSDSQRLTVAINSGEPFDIVKELRETNFDVKTANECMMRKLLKEELKAISKAIANVKTYGDITVYTFDARKKEFEIDYSRIKDKSLWMFSSTADLKVLLVLVVFEGEVKGSFRSYCEKDVNVLAEKLGGGGHKKASGFTSTLPENYIIAIAQEFYKK